MSIGEFNNIKIFDIVVCNNKNHSFLTYKKCYKVLYTNYNIDCLIIKCDDDEIKYNNHINFMSLKEYKLIQRKKKLNKLMK